MGGGSDPLPDMQHRPGGGSDPPKEMQHHPGGGVGRGLRCPPPPGGDVHLLLEKQSNYKRYNFLALPKLERIKKTKIVRIEEKIYVPRRTRDATAPHSLLTHVTRLRAVPRHTVTPLSISLVSSV